MLPTPENFDANYYEKYGVRVPGIENPHYRHCWKKINNLTFFKYHLDRYFPERQNILVLGSATGEILEEIEAMGHASEGIEFSPWAFENTPEELREKVHFGDMRDVVPQLINKGKKFDTVYTNNLIYLDEDQLPEFLSHLKRLASNIFVTLAMPYTSQIFDRRQQIFRNYGWWLHQFQSKGFEPRISPYLFQQQPNDYQDK